MIPEVAAILITLLLGPVAFYLLSRKGPKPRFPVSIYDGIGDIILLPIFNGLAVHYGILALIPTNYSKLAIAIAVGYIIGRVWMIYRKDFAKHNDWCRPKQGRYSLGGWWHQIFLFAQAFLLLISILHLYDRILLWIPLAIYLVLIGVLTYKVNYLK